MASFTHKTNAADTANVTAYVTPSFTPVAGDLLSILVMPSATVATGTATASANGITFSKVTAANPFIGGATQAGASENAYFFVANQLVGASPVAMTVTFDCTGDAATGANTAVCAVGGMTKTGLTAIRQAGVQNNATGTPTVTLPQGAALTTNPLIGFVGMETVSANVAVPPTGWAEQIDTGYITPATGIQYCTIASGFTGSTVTWTSAAGGVFGAYVVEFDASGSGGTPARVPRSPTMVRTAVLRASNY